MSVSSLYEVRCEACRVSFPLGTKTCLHCGGRLGKQPRQPPPRPIMRGQAPQGLEDFISGEPEVQRELEDLSPPPPPAGERESSGTRTAIRLGVNFLWILGAILITALQMCRGG